MSTNDGTIRISVTAQNNARAALAAAQKDIDDFAKAARKAEDDAAKTSEQKAALKARRAQAAAAEALKTAQRNVDDIAKIMDEAAKADQKRMDDLRRSARALASDMRRIGADMGRSFSGALGGIAGGAGFAAKLAAIGEAALLAAPSLIAGGQAIITFGKAAGTALPALAALAAAGIFVKMTMAEIMPAITRYMKPIADAFDVASQKASFWATRGIRPLAAEWAKAGMPIVSRDMTGIAREVNLVIKGFLEWGKSTAGLKALSEVTNATARGMKTLGPSVQGVAISFGNMLGRISEVSIAAGGNGLSGILDKLNGKMDKITGESVAAGLDKLKDAFQDVKDAIEWVQNAVSIGTEFWKKYETQIGYVRDGLSLLAIAFGGPIGIAIGGASLIQRHWDKVKPAIDGVKEALEGMDTSGVQGAMERLGNAGKWLKDEWQDMVDWFKGTLWPLIQEELPAIWDAARDALRNVSSAWDDNKEAIGRWYGLTKELFKWVAENLVPVLGRSVVTALRMLDMGVSTAIRGFGLFARAITTMVTVSLRGFGMLLDGAATAFGWIPGIGDKLKKSNAQFKAWSARVLASMNSVPNNKTINIHLATGAFYAKMAGMRAALNDVQFASAGRYAHGGIVGAATGGIHGGLRLVGEQGPELVSMAPGSTVHPAGTTRNMLSGSGQGQGAPPQVVVDIRGGNDDFAVLMRKLVKIYGGGSVQAAFGQGAG